MKKIFLFIFIIFFSFAVNSNEKIVVLANVNNISITNIDLKNEITTTFDNEKNQFEVSYYEEAKIGNAHYVDAEYERKFDNNLNFSMGIRKNLQEDFTETNFIGANYDSDCLKIELNLSKKFYNNQDIRPSNNLTFSIMLKPFGKPMSPDISNLLNKN